MVRRKLIFIGITALLAALLWHLGLPTRAQTPGPTEVPLQIVPTATPTPTPNPFGPAGDRYADPRYGWSVRWDPHVWAATLHGRAVALDGLSYEVAIGPADAANLSSFPPSIDLASPASCLTSVEAQGSMTQQFGAGGKPLRGIAAQRSWSVYSSGKQAGYVECRVLVPGQALLVIEATGPLDQFNTVAPDLQRVLATIRLPSPGTPTAGASPVATDNDVATGCWSATQRVGSGSGHRQWSAPPSMTIDPDKHYTALLRNNKGTIRVELFPQEAPQTANNFVCLAESGYYDGTPFHRIVPGFVVQGGDPTGTGMGGPGYTFPDEPVGRDYVPGTLAMANAGPNTNGSQFFIVLSDLRGQLPKNYTIFGQVTQGMNVVEAIAQTPTKVGPTGEQSVPTQAVTLERVTIVVSPGPASPAATPGP